VGVTTDNSVLRHATTFSLTDAFVVQALGEYHTLGVPTFQGVTFNGFTFNPPVASVTPLWTFTFGGSTFSFDATSVESTWVQGVTGISTGEWDIIGTGIGSITGFSATPGTFTINLSDSGNMAVAFDSTAAVTAPTESLPDGGNSVALLGGALTVLGLFSRKFSC